MRVIDGPTLQRLTPYPALIAALRDRLAEKLASPPRLILDPTGQGDALLLMPAWRESGLMVVKLVTVYPRNAEAGRPALDASVTVFDQRDGRLRAILDGVVLTVRRTAAASALGAALLARPDCATLLVIGTGALAPALARAHLAAQPTLKRVLVWGRTPAKAELLAAGLRAEGIDAATAPDLDAAIAEADTIVAATTAAAPIIPADAVRSGTHLSLVGAFTPAMAEAEPALMPRARVFADDRASALVKGGEVAQAIKAGLIGEQAIVADLAELVRDGPPPRRPDDITVFKSVGFAALDLIAVELAMTTST
ncbi:ornithine cyclodeaminase family protein [Elioraea sp.]|uniref:ornithine cyclodeaminase family protein n=1 Tax=Elioraea sp. TaxID=2185103 RepID=UPI003F6F39AD